MIKIVIHHTCKSSYVLYKALRGVPGITFEMVGTLYFPYLKRYVLSVPAVFANGKLVLVDPVEPGDIIALKDGRTKKELDIEEAIENFVRGIMASQAILTAVMLYKSLKPVLDPELVAVLSRARYHEQEDKIGQIVHKLQERGEELLQEHWESFIKLLTFGLVRELYWLGIDINELEISHIKMWLLAKATLGRLGLPYPKPSVPDDVATAVYATLKESGQRYMDKIAEEQNIIATDREFLALIQEY